MRDGGDGPLGEEVAARALITRGYKILARNVKSKVGELDIVATDRGVLCFVEVRLRRDGSAAFTVNAAKQLRVRRAAEQYLASRGKSSAACRFDVVTVSAGLAVEIIQDAF